MLPVARLAGREAAAPASRRAGLGAHCDHQPVEDVGLGNQAFLETEMGHQGGEHQRTAHYERRPPLLDTRAGPPAGWQSRPARSASARSTDCLAKR